MQPILSAALTLALLGAGPSQTRFFQDPVLQALLAAECHCALGVVLGAHAMSQGMLKAAGKGSGKSRDDAKKRLARPAARLRLARHRARVASQMLGRINAAPIAW